MPKNAVIPLSCALAGTILIFAAASATAQTTPTSPWTGSRTADGQPDVQGQWVKSWDGSRGANFDLEKGIHPDEVKLTGRNPEDYPPPKVVQTPDGKIPYQPWARALRAEIEKNFFNPTELVHIDSNARCLQMGIPRQSLDTGFEIVQAPGYFFFLYGYNSASRTIALDDRPHLDDRVKLWQGDSVGHWEGNTLVVSVRNLNEHAWYDAYGNFHSDQLTLQERWVFVSPDRVHYEVVSTDPKVFTQPWMARNEFTRSKEKIEQWETSCYEGERNVESKIGEKAKRP